VQVTAQLAAGRPAAHSVGAELVNRLTGKTPTHLE